MLQIEEATEVEVSLLIEGGAHIQSGGGSLDFFNRDVTLKDLHHTVGFFHERLDLMEGHGRRAAGGRPTS
jgi:hypothetical protein